MNMNSLIAFAAVDGVLLITVAILYVAGRRARREIKCDRVRTIGEADEIRSVVAGLQMQLTEMKEMTQMKEKKQAVAQTFANVDRYVLNGTAKGQTSNSLSLNAYNVPPGSVVVTVPLLCVTCVMNS